ncbi:hypothetical protein HYW19_01455 [Candidatus Woesearchaeota archaeon]|nr:hypothetical protein [Candidatus Woesearchaeota archaeon]
MISEILVANGINTNTAITETTFEIDNDLRITDLSELHKNEILYFLVIIFILINIMNQI